LIIRLRSVEPADIGSENNGFVRASDHPHLEGDGLPLWLYRLS
jgi:hypothetical protein